MPILLFAPCVLVYAIFFIWPQASLLAISASSKSGLSFDQYARFFGDGYYWEILGRTLGMGIAVTAITLVLGLPTAYVLARSQSRWASLLLLLTTFPLLVSAVVRSFGWMVLFFRDGLVSRVLLMLGLIDRPVQTMYTMTGVIIALAQVLLPLMVLTLHGVFKSIDRDLEYAAMSLGARPAVALGLVTLRLARGGIVAGSLLVFSLAISAFATPSLVGGARANVMATAIYEQTVELLDWPFGAALAAILLVVVLGLSLAYGALIEGRGELEAPR
ncbi:ABC transporter permease [Bosea psychrotolerans]|uniref:Putative spermidine/putrescine transport system permease protein n=1 Tax=Bosea psychrotolerans TaxID=1871628 RepID=A0A2S4MDD4_9HYPH|nr:ABC transporter permease [Bosea psychrotolerans]POR52457.1 putative spermidine/putrescine transport system permease protein [Bosea psychrotolerans]